MGHPLVVLLTMGGAAYLGWHCYLNATNGTVFAMLGGLWIVWQSLKDFDHRRRYREWRSDCMAMAGITPRSIQWPVRLLAAVFSVAAVVALASQNIIPERMIVGGITLMSATGAILLLAKAGALIWRFLHRERPNRPVSAAGGKSQLPVPSLKKAYRSLPDYCKPLMKDRS